jgi:ketosteroid isomerase-like protein
VDAARNVDVVRDSIDVIFNRGLFDRIPEFYSPDFRSHVDGFGFLPWEPGWDGLRDHVELIRQMWPDYHEHIELIYGHEDLVTVHMTLTGTSTNSGTLPANGKGYRVRDIMICRVREGRLFEQWGVTDNYTRLIQLALVDPVV